MKKLLLLLLIPIFFQGCARKIDYSWKEYPIKPERIQQISFEKGASVALATGISNRQIALLANASSLLKYYGSHQMLADAIVTQLNSEMTKRGVRVSNNSLKQIKVSVDSTSYAMTMRNEVTMGFAIEFGGGQSIPFSVTNKTPWGYDHAFNGAVALAVIKILNNEQVRSYLNE